MRSDCNSYLAGRDELQRTKGSLQVLGVALEIEESASDGGLELGGALPGGGVEGNLVDGGHDCDGADVLVTGVDRGRSTFIERWEFAVGSTASLRVPLVPD